MADTNLFSVLSANWRTHADRKAFDAPGSGVLTYADLATLTGQFAAALRERGVVAGDRVVAQVDKSLGSVALYLATLQLGAVFVPLNTAYTAAEVDYFLGDSEPKLFVARAHCAEDAASCAQRTGIGSPALLGTSDEVGLWHEARQHEPLPVTAHRRGDDLAAIVYTSGTTGRSKGAMMSHAALASNARALAALWQIDGSDVLLHALPIFHVHGLFVALNTALLSGASINFLARFDVREVIDALPGATLLMGVPTFYSRLLGERDFAGAHCARIRLFVSGSAPLSARDWERWLTRTGHAIVERYGMSEAGIIASNPVDGERLPGTVGYALPGVDVRVCDADGVPLPAGTVGGIEIRGPNLFDGYWRQPDKTAEDVRSSGFFITGDLGSLSDDGRLTIVGRNKDLIISGGYNVYPKEVEAVLDGVAGIDASAVIGAPHEDLGEGIVACLVGDAETATAETIDAALAANLARFKHPRRLVWVEALPRNALGKVQKNVLRDLHAAAFTRQR